MRKGVLATVAWLVVACGGSIAASPDGGGAEPDGGRAGPCALAPALDPSKRFDELTPEQVIEFCNAEKAYLDCALGPSEKQILCTLGGAAIGLLTAPATDEQLRSTCKAYFDSCMANPETWTCAVERARGCMATVQQGIVCVPDLVAQIIEVSGSINSCDTVTREMVKGLSTMMRPASCQATDACR
jgi:hypothetical protein